MRISDWSSDVCSSDLDRSRFADARARLNESPLGAAALAGTSFPLDRDATASALGFDRPMANSIDAVSDRDFALEFCASASISAIHLSRLAEEIVICASQSNMFALTFCGRSEERRVGKELSVRVDLGGRRITKKKKNQPT